jgi:1-acyl-sn-glycerol-3-phosphate acyltransferase
MFGNRTLFPFMNEDDSSLDTTNIPFLLMAVGMTICLIKACEKFALSQNRLDYDHHATRILSGLFRFIANSLHTKKDDIQINGAGKIIVLGPHQTGYVDGSVFASKMVGTPPTFLATDSYNRIPGIGTVMKMAKVIQVPADKSKPGTKSEIDLACEVLDKNGCIVLFPQGEFSMTGQEPPIVKQGAALMALKSKKPISVYRLDGFPSIENKWFPLFITNSRMYRALLTAFYPNNVTVRFCREINEHLKPENADLTDEQKCQLIDKMCAEMFRSFYVTKSLTAKQNDFFNNEIPDTTHHTLWGTTKKQLQLKRALKAVNAEKIRLEHEINGLKKEAVAQVEEVVNKITLRCGK